MVGEPSAAARGLKQLRERAGLSMRMISDALGWNLTRYQHYEDRFKRPFLPIDLTVQLSEILVQRGIDPAEVFALAGIKPKLPINDGPIDDNLPYGTSQERSGGFRQGLRSGQEAGYYPGTLPATFRNPATERLLPASHQPVHDLPVIGSVKGGRQGFYFNNGEPQEFVLRPASLAGVANAFALYVEGDSMEPRYFAGEILYVNPNRPVTRHCFVAVELTDGQGLIKQFLQQNEDALILYQFNPPQEIRLPMASVRQIYRITGSGENG